MISLALLMLATVIPQWSPENTGTIASNAASYDGSMLVLDGDVSLEHGFGKMKAEKAVLTRPLQEQEEFPFTCIELADVVRLSLTTEAQVECERAVLDFSTMKGTLSSPDNVHYLDTINSTPFELFSPKLDLQMMKNQKEYVIQTAHAQKGVHIIYNKLYHLTAQSLDWQHIENHLVLKGSPKIQEPSLGTITASQEIDLFLKERKLHKLKTAGSTQLISHAGHTLKTEGAVILDTDTKTATIHPHTTQLVYQEEQMTLTADEAQMHYREDGEGLHPERLELQGNIKIFSQDRRGVADMLIYHPETRVCILKALPGRKVLFTRDQDQLCISANEVHITYNPETKEQEVRGIGHITMTLSPEEQNLLNKVFSNDASSP
jgi:lipopolysaccharide export system protein LptA